MICSAKRPDKQTKPNQTNFIAYFIISFFSLSLLLFFFCFFQISCLHIYVYVMLQAICIFLRFVKKKKVMQKHRHNDTRIHVHTHIQIEVKSYAIVIAAYSSDFYAGILKRRKSDAGLKELTRNDTKRRRSQEGHRPFQLKEKCLNMAGMR